MRKLRDLKNLDVTNSRSRTSKEAKGPEKFGRYEFKEQDIKAATDECDAGGKPGPEFVPTVRDKEPNLALLKDAKGEASSQLEGWCPRRHCTEYLNDGFYNNCRSWIIGAIPGWAQIDMGDVANVNRIRQQILVMPVVSRDLNSCRQFEIKQNLT
jgi:hypothetical protein